jgi:hypothetical protein
MCDGIGCTLANPYDMATILILAKVHWPVWIGPLSNWVARVVQEVPLKGLRARSIPLKYPCILHDKNRIDMCVKLCTELSGSVGCYLPQCVIPPPLCLMEERLHVLFAM